ncbi:SLC13 family permease [Candidatus Hartigia pinicola]
MNGEFLWVLSLLLVSMVLFTTNKIRMDVVALLVIVTFVLSDTLTLEEAISGFSDSNVLLIAALFVIGDGLVRTGIALQVGNFLFKIAGSSEKKMLVFLMLTVSLLGSFMSSTGVVAIFIPVVLSISKRMNISPSRFMMPLGFVGLISGMMTLVATPPNMIINSELVRKGITGFQFFSITPIGITILLAGIVYMLITGRYLKRNKLDKLAIRYQRTFCDLIKDYKLTGNAHRLKIQKGSPLIGISLNKARLHSRYKANVVGIERWRKFRRVMISATGGIELKEQDILFIDISVSDHQLKLFYFEQKLKPMILGGHYFSAHSRYIGMAEVLINPDSDVEGKSLRNIKFRTCYDLNVVGIRRNGKILENKLIDQPLRLGDILLVIGCWKLIQMLSTKTHNFIILNIAEEFESVTPASSQAPQALLCLFLMIVMMVNNEIPNFISALISCLLMGKFRCINLDSAYKAIHWPSIILIVGMMPFSLALQKTGGISLAVNFLMNIAGNMEPRIMLLCLFILCASIGLFISNTVTAVLMAPIAISAANHMSLSPLPFAMIVGIAASSAFMTPISSPVNTLVLTPGNYKFSDFVKIGVPFTMIVMLISVLIIPILFPF